MSDDVLSKIKLPANSYKRVGYDEREISFSAGETIGFGAFYFEIFWSLKFEDSVAAWTISPPAQQTCQLTLGKEAMRRGKWEHGGEMPIELEPLSTR